MRPTCWASPPAAVATLVILLTTVSNSDAFTTSPGLNARARISYVRTRTSRSRIPQMDAGLPPYQSGLAAMSKALSSVLEAVSDVQDQLTLPQVSLPEVKFSAEMLSVQSLDSSTKLDLSAIMKSLQAVDVSKLGAGAHDFPQQLLSQAAEALSLGSILDFDPQRLMVEVSQALDAVIAQYPALSVPLGHLRASLSLSLEALEQAYLAGAALVPEQYQAVVTILIAGTASTVLGIALGEAAEVRKLEAAAQPTPAGDLPLPTRYDLPAIMNYYNRRPLTLLGRLSDVSSRLGSLALKLWLDRNVGDGSAWQKNMQSRAEEFLDFVQGAGPAFIKIGQGISIRPDILPEPYLRELVKLQDRVKPFNSGDARDILTQQLGKPLSEIFVDADTAFKTPVAAASLGQVYRATLLNGDEVAVKVQRPDVLESVTLDLYVIRLILLFLSNWKSVRESALSVLGVIDNWADRFIQELDYLQEAANGDRFRAEMAASKALGEAILVPQVYLPLTTRYTLVTEWVDGVKVDVIDSATPEGRERLKKVVATLLNSYLAQMLESGFLHADPHPGNFLCTPDGKLCVLDMGLMTEVEEDRRYALLEYVSHLTARDYEATLNDLIVLGFIPKEIGNDPKKAAVVVPLLATVLEQLSNGGGAKSVTVESVGEEIEELGRQYPVVIPAYFGLIIRAFSALEGLGLRLDPQYSIVNECFPYLARRLLTDDSPRMRKMLRTFLYGKDGRYLQVDRVDDLVEGYAQFTSLADEASKGVTVGGTKDPLGRVNVDNNSALVSAGTGSTTAPAQQPFGSPTSRRLQRATTAAAEAGVSLGGSSRQANPVFGERIAGDGFRTSPVFASRFAGDAGVGDGVNGGNPRREVDPVQDPVARDALKLLFAKEGNYVQELVVEELVRMTDALSREANLQIIQALRRLTEAPLSPTRIAQMLAEAPLNPLLAPLQIPVKVQSFALSRIFSRLEVALELTQEDQESLKALRRLQDLVHSVVEGSSSDDRASTSTSAFSLPLSMFFPLLPGGRDGSAPALGPREAVDTARQVAAIVALIGPGLQSIVQKFLIQLSTRTLDRLADSLEDQGSVSPLGQQTSPRSRSRFYDDVE